MIDPSTLPYRPCIGIMLVNRGGLVFVGKRIDNREGDFWQMPQGGIDDGEALETAAMRELHEETGVTADKLAVLSWTREELFYDLPPELLGKLWKGRFRGQRQRWMLARFQGSDDDVQLDAHQPAEFCDWKWVEVATLPDLIVPFKKHVYRSVVDEFLPLI